MAQKMASLMVIITIMTATAMCLGARGAITCGSVLSAVSGCEKYITNGGSVPSGCCEGIKELYAEATTSAERQTICKCLKSAASEVPNYKPTLLAGLPKQCGVNIPYKISPSTNCNTLK